MSSDKFEKYESLILSEQIPQDEVPRFLGHNPDFATWYCERAKSRRVSHDVK